MSAPLWARVGLAILLFSAATVFIELLWKWFVQSWWEGTPREEVGKVLKWRARK